MSIFLDATDPLVNKLMVPNGITTLIYPKDFAVKMTEQFSKTLELLPRDQIVKPEWTGEGEPPVGIEIEARLPGIGSTTYFWQRAKVVHGSLPDSPREILVFSLETTRPAWSDEFRPIRTPEKIAAEERAKAITKMEFDTDCLDRGAFTKLYDAGYRKQVQP